jgi:hypothetical protein
MRPPCVRQKELAPSAKVRRTTPEVVRAKTRTHSPVCKQTIWLHTHGPRMMVTESLPKRKAFQL